MHIRVKVGGTGIFFFLPDPSTMQNLSFKGCRRFMPGKTINITFI